MSCLFFGTRCALLKRHFCNLPLDVLDLDLDVVGTFRRLELLLLAFRLLVKVHELDEPLGALLPPRILGLSERRAPGGVFNINQVDARTAREF